MLKKVSKFKKEILIIIVTALVTGVIVNNLNKPELKIPYPHTQPLSTEFEQLTCEQVSQTYMRAWSKGSDVVHDSTARVQLSLSEEKLRKWESGYRDSNGNIIDSSKIKKSTIVLSLNDNKATFIGDNLWNVENKPFQVNINNQNLLAGAMTISNEEQSGYDVAGTFMLDKVTSLLILTDTDTMFSQNGSFGTRSRLFTCAKSE